MVIPVINLITLINKLKIRQGAVKHRILVM